MRSFPGEPTSESSFFQFLRSNAASVLYMERIEPRTEGGFPDIYFVLRAASSTQGEGTIELKFHERADRDLKKLIRPSQLVNILDYHEAGGKRRFLLAYLGGVMMFYDTPAYAELARRGSLKVMPTWMMDIRNTFPKMDNVASAQFLSKQLITILRG